MNRATALKTAKPINFTRDLFGKVIVGDKTETRRLMDLNLDGRVERAGKQWHPDDSNEIQGAKFKVGDLAYLTEPTSWVHESIRKFAFSNKNRSINDISIFTTYMVRSTSWVHELYHTKLGAGEPPT